MLDNFNRKILSNLNIEFALFDKDLILKDSTKTLTKFFNFSPDVQHHLFDIFPEFFGLEDQIDKLMKGHTKVLNLSKINKLISEGELIYLDFVMIKYDKHILLLIKNSTDQSLLEQKIQQQNNEIKILKETIGQLKGDSINNIWGKSEAIQNLKKFILKVADLDKTTILLTGNSGTGKTLIARSIHGASLKFDAPFVEINCATIPETLIESEIFGHVRGAFTNAIDNKKGLLEEADGGTLFLDEIGELPISVQPKFLTFLETKKYRPVGSTKEVEVKVRIIAATNKNLKRAVKNNEFREDLYYRINVVSLNVPDLIDREQDVLILADNFVKLFAKDLNKRITGFSESAREFILNYTWPGNIRELKNILERTVIFCEKEIIDKDDLLIDEYDANQNKKSIIIPENGLSLEEIEKQYLISALKKADENQTKAAKLLGMSLDTFRYRIKKFDLL